ncbi:olfactory receptor 13F1-like [Spea bombifrons]|uniref:olfactory receptor 13F1-like n=1 Tax=Spea bombifrons TaxID=233779 RepID=UPI00234A7A6B|nr:olfactory receptor 13F1-like [Spea bombifrons]
MEDGNQTLVKEFILTGLSQNQGTRIILFILFSVTYSLTIVGNIILICVVLVSRGMHTPMYYFLCNLSFLDLFYSSTTVPKMLVDTFSGGGGRISFLGCMIQMSMGLFLGETECILLAVMAYDRYVAICLPLRYMVIMSWRICKNITVVLWLGSLLLATVPMMSRPFSFCGENKINHFTCEILALLKLACGDISFYQKTIFFISLFTILSPFAFIGASYLCIIRSLLKIQSVSGRSKAFSTCVSHLTVVFMFYGTSITMYMGSKNNSSANQKFVSIIYGIVTPVLNPLIYSLRNGEVKRALRKMFSKKLER